MPTTALQIQREQQRADAINQVQAALTDSTKTLTADILSALVTFAKGRDEWGNLTIDERNLNAISQREATHWTAIQTLTAQVQDHAQRTQVLTNRLNDIRTYLRVETAEQLAAAVAAGQSVPIAEATLLRLGESPSNGRRRTRSQQ